MILFPIMNLYLLTLRQSRQRDGIPRFYALEYFLHYIEIVFVAEKAIFRLFGLIGENCFGILTNLLLFPFWFSQTTLMFYLLTRLFELLLNLGLEPGSDHLCSLTLSFYLAESSYFGKDFFFIDQIILLLFVTF